MRIHIDTDFGGDPDDACALALALAWPGAEITGLTTTLDRGGRRAGCLRHYLKLAGRLDIPLAAGAPTTLDSQTEYLSTADDPRYWPEPTSPFPSPPGSASDLLERSIEKGATIVAIGPATNLAALEIARPGSLSQVPVVFMGGWIEPPAAGLPPWGPERDWNVQTDIQAALIVSGAADLTLVTLPATLRAHLRETHIRRLRAAGAIGSLLALQSTVHAKDIQMPELANQYRALPDDLLNFHYDPVTCAVALNWAGATVHGSRLQPHVVDGVLRFEPAEVGRQARIVTDIDGLGFSELWLQMIERLNLPPKAEAAQQLDGADPASRSRSPRCSYGDPGDRPGLRRLEWV